MIVFAPDLLGPVVALAAPRRIVEETSLWP